MNTEKIYPYQNLLLTDMEGEIWKGYPGLEEYCMISNLGRVKTLDRYIEREGDGSYLLEGRIIKQTLEIRRRPNLKGEFSQMLYFKIRVEGRVYSMSVARAVYVTFVKKLDFKKDKLRVVHIDDNERLNNGVGNIFATNGSGFINRNIALGKAKAPDTTLYSEETWRGIREKKMVQVSQYDRAGNFIATFESIKEAEKVTGANSTAITEVLKGNMRTAKNFIWHRGPEKKLSARVLAKHNVPELHPTSKSVRQYDLQGNFIAIYPSITEAHKATGVNRNLIDRVASGKNKTGGGYIWSFGSGKKNLSAKQVAIHNAPVVYYRSKKISQYDLQGGFITTYSSIAEAARITGTHKTAINRVVLGNGKTAGNYIWRFGSKKIPSKIIKIKTKNPK